MTLTFIPPSEPVEQQTPPVGKGWCHEIKWDGYRLQLHKDGANAWALSINGNDMTQRFRWVAVAMTELPCKSCVIDAEGVAPTDIGNPDFRALVGGQKWKMAACFDLLEIDGQDVRGEPLLKRRARLERLLKRAKAPELAFSAGYTDAVALLTDACKAGLEGIVSKRTDQPYVSGRNRGWVKVKCHAWRTANRDRGEMFAKRQPKRQAKERAR